MGLCQTLDKGLNKKGIPFDPALQLGLAKVRSVYPKAVKCARQLQFIFREVSVFSYHACCERNYLLSMGGTSCCVCSHKATRHYGPDPQRMTLGSCMKGFSLCSFLCCFGRLCNDGKMIFPLFIPFSQCHSSCCCSNLFLQFIFS